MNGDREEEGKETKTVEGQMLLCMMTWFLQNPDEHAKFAAWCEDRVKSGDTIPLPMAIN
jgi:hypothetical protein